VNDGAVAANKMISFSGYGHEKAVFGRLLRRFATRKEPFSVVCRK